MGTPHNVSILRILLAAASADFSATDFISAGYSLGAKCRELRVRSLHGVYLNRWFKQRRMYAQRTIYKLAIEYLKILDR